jgi:hypothetical protein
MNLSVTDLILIRNYLATRLDSAKLDSKSAKEFSILLPLMDTKITNDLIKDEFKNYLKGND